jgi:hypothetical protein
MNIAALARPVPRAPVVDVTIPAFNEERALDRSEALPQAG